MKSTNDDLMKNDALKNGDDSGDDDDDDCSNNIV